MTRHAVYLRAKRRFVRSPGFFLPGAVLLILLLSTLDLSLRGFLLIQSDGLNDCNPGQVIQPFRIHNQAKSSLGGILKEVERVLRVFPARDDLFAPI
jgi:hypothetical protein